VDDEFDLKLLAYIGDKVRWNRKL